MWHKTSMGNSSTCNSLAKYVERNELGDSSSNPGRTFHAFHFALMSLRKERVHLYGVNSRAVGFFSLDTVTGLGKRKPKN